MIPVASHTLALETPNRDAMGALMPCLYIIFTALDSKREPFVEQSHLEPYWQGGRASYLEGRVPSWSIGCICLVSSCFSDSEAQHIKGIGRAEQADMSQEDKYSTRSGEQCT